MMNSFESFNLCTMWHFLGLWTWITWIMMDLCLSSPSLLLEVVVVSGPMAFSRLAGCHGPKAASADRESRLDQSTALRAKLRQHLVLDSREGWDERLAHTALLPRLRAGMFRSSNFLGRMDATYIVIA